MDEYQGKLPLEKDLEHKWKRPLTRIGIFEKREDDEEAEEVAVFHEHETPPMPSVGQSFDLDRGLDKSEEEGLDWESVGEYIVDDIEYSYGFGTYSEEDEDVPTDRLFVNVYITVEERE